MSIVLLFYLHMNAVYIWRTSFTFPVEIQSHTSFWYNVSCLFSLQGINLNEFIIKIFKMKYCDMSGGIHWV